MICSIDNVGQSRTYAWGQWAGVAGAQIGVVHGTSASGLLCKVKAPLKDILKPCLTCLKTFTNKSTHKSIAKSIRRCAYLCVKRCVCVFFNNLKNSQCLEDTCNIHEMGSNSVIT